MGIEPFLVASTVEGVMAQRLVRRLCVKCKEEPTSDFELCRTCLHTNLVSKFKTAVNKNSLVTPVDHVLVALSGGPASRFESTRTNIFI